MRSRRTGLVLEALVLVPILDLLEDLLDARVRVLVSHGVLLVG